MTCIGKALYLCQGLLIKQQRFLEAAKLREDLRFLSVRSGKCAHFNRSLLLQGNAALYGLECFLMPPDSVQLVAQIGQEERQAFLHPAPLKGRWRFVLRKQQHALPVESNGLLLECSGSLDCSLLFEILAPRSYEHCAFFQQRGLQIRIRWQQRL